MWVFEAKINPQTQLVDLWSRKAADRLSRSSSAIRGVSFPHFPSAQTQRGELTDSIFLCFLYQHGAGNGSRKVSPCFYQAVTFNTLDLLIKRRTSPESLQQPLCCLLPAPAACRHRSHPRAAASTPPLPERSQRIQKLHFKKRKSWLRGSSGINLLVEGGLKKISQVSSAFFTSDKYTRDIRRTLYHTWDLTRTI